MRHGGEDEEQSSLESDVFESTNKMVSLMTLFEMSIGLQMRIHTKVQ